eukprot:CAMPEP_0182493712 /NCGR_PEP_ID=MMETSP1321-20130603/2634_1 /TAXON_ID=91990 /ORGANISM="Bolidomonas sp., Strain RCC1657" /LENGTH=37 /DNA_ID= /DNA_START= /DNA_END= /DNA_ORIENTATION=
MTHNAHDATVLARACRAAACRAARGRAATHMNPNIIT